MFIILFHSAAAGTICEMPVVKTTAVSANAAIAA
jgi:hypothetical protein